MRYLLLVFTLVGILSCNSNKGPQQTTTTVQGEQIEISADPPKKQLTDSAFCTDLFINSKLILWTLSSSMEKPIVSIKELVFSFDSNNNQAHLQGKFTDAREYHGKKNRLYRFNLIMKDTIIENAEFELYEITKDCFGKSAEFATREFRKNGKICYNPHVIGQRIYMGYGGDFYADLINETEVTRTYRTSKYFDPTSLRDFSIYYDDDFPTKYYVIAPSSEPYAKVEHWKDLNRLVVYNFRGNTYFILNYDTLELLERDYIN